MSSEPKSPPTIKPYEGPAGGWGSARSLAGILVRERIPVEGAVVLGEQNKPEGYMCVSCAWQKPAKTLLFEYCENGAKASAWEITRRRADRDFFAANTLAELESWTDHDLEAQGRLTHPMRWDAASDRYVPVSWDEAFAAIGAAVRAADPHDVEFYASGRASLETAYMWQLWARIYGSNNLPDCSNMCHESTSAGLPESIGSSVGTATLQDFEACDCIFYIAQNAGTSSPRILHQLQEAVQRGVKIVAINPLRERGLERFTNPQSPTEMALGKQTPIASAYYQVKNGGDVAALFGISKALLEMDDAYHAGDRSRVTGADGEPEADAGAAEVAFAAAMAAVDTKHVLDHDFIAAHTTGFDDYAAACRAHDWAELERVSGLSRAQMEEAAGIYAGSSATLICYGMGLTQHVMGVQNVHMAANLALLRGNVGKPGGNICAIRGHSNVQGQRTVGITEKPGLAPLDKLSELYKFDPPRWEGHSTVDACKAILEGGTQVFLALGGNFLRAAPETAAMEAAWRKLPMTVAIATKLNRSHVVHGREAYVLPCLGRLELDAQAGGPQAVSMESSVAHFHGSRGKVKPASEELLSEPAIVAGLAKATLQGKGEAPWDAWVDDYAVCRDAIEATYPETFRDFNKRLFQPGGFARPVPARERKWVTRTGKANFLTPDRLTPELKLKPGDDVLQLASLRSNDQFNTTVYGYSDRFRGVDGTRMVVFLNRADLARLGLADGDPVDLETALDDGVERRVKGLRAVAYDIPAGCCGAYFPEVNPLFPLAHHDPKSKVPAYKALPVHVRRGQALAPG